MPKKLLIAVFDKKANHYDNFFITNSIAEAIRSFSIASNDPNTNLNKFPDEFELYKLAEINQDTGIITNVNIEALGLARTYIKTVE